MSEQAYHEMVLDNTYPSGAEEWYCPTCGRRFLMQWPPAYNKVILDPGDETAIHSGGKGSQAGQSSSVLPEEKGLQVDIDMLSKEEEESLIPWTEWFDRIDFESLWNKTIDLDVDK